MAEIATKMKVTGVAQFVDAMKQSKAAVKTLDAELKLAQAQYKQTGDKEEYLRQRTEILKKQIAEQEKVVKSAQQALAQMTTNGTDPASAAYQNMAAQVANAQTSLIQMQTALSQGTDAFDEGTDAVDEYADRLEHIDKNVSFQSTIEGLKAVKGAIQTAINVAKGINDIVVDAGKWADDETTTVAQYDDFIPDAETLQQYEYAADRLKVDFNDVLKAWDRINRLQREGGSILFGDYGIADLGSAEENFWGILDAIQQITDENERNNITQDIFGKSWRELKPLFGSRDLWNQYMEEARVISNEGVEKLAAANDKDEELTSAWENFKRNLALWLDDPITKRKDDFITTLDSLSAMMNGSIDFLTGITNMPIFASPTMSRVGNAVVEAAAAKLGINPEEIGEMLPEMESASEQYAQTIVEGMEANSEAAYEAGRAYAEDIIRGMTFGFFGFAGGGGSPVYNTDNTYINGVNVYGATSPEEIAAAYTGEMNRNRAGTGG